ncbi:MAG: RsmE family RNA methyltransferase [Candidatus Dojkabacteria bacterium]|uniref:Ribosomal RNA small subunit methyltransferase E n=2 Tax=Candidatus Dojkabacteria TaxID=74243 RepID=A0A136KK34_9BACT|nr:MAG: Ribosomal RNA small subunit methyltransferase E [candidate division WS6 bacterium OLB21]MBW7953745.1 16S rRNA (uracil(1498)-N(3))-methyltransferase [Candidatus Dojkabacteria bacterium]WKZ27455.1 MAG: RsmE family RNA methyltransferase [Candidatus Dojkabacteria bacterium]
MHRIYVSPDELNDNSGIISDPQTVYYLGSVLRIRVGENIELFDGLGNLFNAQVTKATKREVEFSISASTFFDRPNSPTLILAQARPKAGKIDDILRMNTEVGVSAFIVFEAERSQGKPDNHPDKIVRKNKILQEASRQSERLYVPELAIADDIVKVLNTKADHKAVLVSREHEGSVDIAKFKESIQNQDRVIAMVGPEGGFSQTEIGKAVATGYVPIHLDLPIMRTETAGVVVSGILMY